MNVPKDNQELREIVKKVEEGKLTDLPEEIVLNLKNLKSEDIFSLLDIIRLKSFGPGFIQEMEGTSGALSTDASKNIQMLRAKIDAGQYQDVLENPNLSRQMDPEFIINRARALSLVGNYTLAIVEIQSLLKRSDLLTSTRGVASQLAGHCLLELGKFKESQERLKNALRLSKSTGNRWGELSALLFLSKLSSIQGDLTQSNDYFSASLKKVSKENENFRWILGVYRTWAFILFARSEQRCFEKLFVAFLISKSIGDPIYAAKTLIELIFMAQAFSISIGMELLKEILALARFSVQNENDLKLWLDVFEGQPQKVDPLWPESLKFIYQKVLEARATVGLSPPSSKTKSILVQLQAILLNKTAFDWILDCENGYVISLSDKSHLQFKQHSPMIKILSFLSQFQKPVKIDQCFESVWGLRWNEHLHLNTIAVTLTRINKGSQSYRIKRENAELSIEQPGLIISESFS